MATASVTYNFAPNTLIKSSEANKDFDDLVVFLNNQVIHKDASVAFTNIPSGPGTDPSADNQFARKRYVDRIMQHGSVALSFTASNNDSGSVVFPTAFIAAPTVQLTVRVGSNFDVIANLQSNPTTTGFNWRVFQNLNNSFSGSGTLFWSAFGRY